MQILKGQVVWLALLNCSLVTLYPVAGQHGGIHKLTG